jgi:hypothetical protein
MGPTGQLRVFCSGSYPNGGVTLSKATNDDLSALGGGFDDFVTCTAASGNVGINNPLPSFKLDVNGSSRFQANVGIGADPSLTRSLTVGGNCLVNNNLHLGDVGFNQSFYAGVSHASQIGQTSYALLAGQDGSTYLNCASGRVLYLRCANQDLASVCFFRITLKQNLVLDAVVYANYDARFAGNVDCTQNLLCTSFNCTTGATVTGTTKANGGVQIGNLSTIKFYQTFTVNFTPNANPYDVVVSNVGNNINSFYPIVQIYDTTNNNADAFTTKIVARSLTSFTVRVRRVDSASFGSQVPVLQVFLLGHP